MVLYKRETSRNHFMFSSMFYALGPSPASWSHSVTSSKSRRVLPRQIQMRGVVDGRTLKAAQPFRANQHLSDHLFDQEYTRYKLDPLIELFA
mmetsp:Transcript_10128/g.14632  ORF Transcript_10128/g.14632 Transcript_10128/m.14632 type:complete len:92 (+) Transcript_10128:172-447(+)